MFKTMTTCLDAKKNPKPEEIEKIPSYIFCKWLSGSPMTIGAANQINRFYDIPIQNQYQMIKKAFAGKVKFIPYPKNISEKTDKSIEMLSKHYKITLDKASEYKELMSKEQLKELLDLYSGEEND